MSDLIWGTDAAHTSTGWRPNPSPRKSYWATGPEVGGGEWVFTTVLQMGSIWIGRCKAEEPHICFMIKSAISGGNCLVLLNSSHADVCWPCWFFTSLDDLLICRSACRFFSGLSLQSSCSDDSKLSYTLSSTAPKAPLYKYCFKMKHPLFFPIPVLFE